MASLVCLSCSSGCAGLAALDRQAQVPIGIGHGGVVAPAAPMTLPRFLGLDVVVRRTGLFGQIVREKAAVLVPALEPKPLALPLSHPANADSPSPAVAGAHKTHQAKAAKGAKIKAVAVLAGEDSATNPYFEEGILAALDDVSADVRIAAVQAVLDSKQGCGDRCRTCCSDAIRAKLTLMVFEKTGPCCWFEPSSKARRLARLALDACGGPVDPHMYDQGSIFPVESPPIEIINEVVMEPL